MAILHQNFIGISRRRHLGWRRREIFEFRVPRIQKIAYSGLFYNKFLWVFPGGANLVGAAGKFLNFWVPGMKESAYSWLYYNKLSCVSPGYATLVGAAGKCFNFGVPRMQESETGGWGRFELPEKILYFKTYLTQITQSK